MVKNIMVKVKKSKISGKGVYATNNIPKGTKIIEYIGKKITKKAAEKLPNDRYIFDLNSRYDIDGNYSWNIAGFINHCCEPNCEAEVFKNKIWITSLKSIKKGEELSFNYGYGLDDYKDFPCKCSSSKCVGFILAEEYWSKIKQK